jgi:serine/threonine-protein kinase
MEYVPGPSLATVMKNEGALAAERVDRIVAQICGSLQEAHDKGFVHRDLKPENILLSTHAGEEDFVKVLDFGIAKRAGANVPKITQEGMVLGSPPYMSPEQFSRADLDARSDIYSLAVVAYKALTGQKPFNADKPVEWATEHMTAMPLPFEATPVGAAVPVSMKRAVMRALAKKPSDRPQTMREFYTEFTLGNVRSSLLGRSVAPPAPEMYTPLPPRPASYVPPPAALPTTVDRPLRAAGGTVVLDPTRNPGTPTDIGPAVAPAGQPGAGPAPTRVDGVPQPMAPTGQATAMHMGSDRPPAMHAQSPMPYGANAARGEVMPETVREPVPMTVRDRKRSGAVVASSVAGAVLLIGALVLVGWLIVRGSGRSPAASSTAPTRTSPTAAPVTTTPPPATGVVAPSQTGAPQGTVAPTATTAPTPTPVAVPVSGDACHLCIHHALADRCTEALRFR